ncbi:class I SAM-dependent DNA methyltransferase [Pacificibacter maritimus]|uniref:class I SAM-dependent DNA methyltransferase n=1 Tax=Pacificibacter maritimus TaxID=762213 RepID=UPI0014727A4E|nr:class I SAM-dependent DNA methyltransferase [Pacificibacter maritimus]
MDIEAFIERWQGSGGSEMATAQTFSIELTDLLGVERPYVSDKDGDFLDYRFERPVTLTHTGRTRNGRIDLYKKGHFILEAKQFTSTDIKDKNTLDMFLAKDTPKQSGHGKRGTAKFDDTMLKARNQADNYARAVSKEDGWPPFLMIVDVGHVIELYSDFSGQGQGYTQFPDGNRYRIYLEDLRQPETLDLLRAIWMDPQSLDPSLKSAEVTRDIAAHLAELGKSFEGQGHDSETVARFLMRCLFSMFAEDVDLIPYGSFTELLKKLRGHPEHAEPSLKGLWQTMDGGGFSQVLMHDLKRFNGGLFKDADALPLDNVQLGLLIEAAEADWKQVEPAIFGTLLERALDAKQRHKLGAHYTPRAYVERLVTPTIMEPLREDWRNVQIAVQRLNADGKTDKALDLVKDFHHDLCEVRVLDPACGSGNFLYVALEMMKRLEGEVTALMYELGDTKPLYTVDPHQFLGIELNTWAANVAELVLWIGYLQWHYRTHGIAAPSEPVLRDFKNIENRDAVLEWSARTPRVDDTGAPVTRWDGVTTIRHQVTGEEVPDPEARVQVYDYAKPKATTWPKATFIVGNPPFIGASRLRDSLGDGYVEALWSAYPKMPQSADLVMFWWDKAALAARGFNAKTGAGTRRFGLITTNSLRQTFNRRVLEPHLNDAKKPLSLLFAVPDHPWVDTQLAAAVRIGMTVGALGNHTGRLLTIVTETTDKKDDVNGRSVTFETEIGKIFPNLKIGANVVGAKPLQANLGLSSRGVQLIGSGFIVSPEKAKSLGLGTVPNTDNHIREYRNGRDLTATPRGVMVIDLFGLTEQEVRTHFPLVYQHLADTVKPDRDQNNRDSYRKKWWIHGEPRKELRPALNGLVKYVATVETSKHRFFTMLDHKILPDNKLIALAVNGVESFSILSSRIHEVWALATGSQLGPTPVYVKTLSFDAFPFPDLTDPQKERLRGLGEELDAHRKRQQAAHPKLTLTNMYNVLEKLRAGEGIEGKDKEIYDQGLIGILRDLHDQIDAAVADAYGWPKDLSDEDILMRLVDLNKTRAAEEATGHIRWLRPEYQNPTGVQVEKGKTADMDLGVVAKVEKAPWPKGLPDQIAAVREALVDMGEASPEQIARCFSRARTTAVQPLLESLAALGQADKLDDGKYAA